ncbi:UDP-N-acetylmuramate dehydrogenase [Williamsia sterculiae]|uniref:UDP-N-acetylenolpyruvoylglucosamine reductase n=1 Tax=Williamsia sterculiae TaxID=1344003 RepID=A0A1N7GZB9_9NOCA|nr:UDP-N-acetylmuramate dehydrogenase [Williamsia sterculiae]SIS17911.1 UDP-N-acetylmuramate dehydrogenase [Williamsia sterculiae]
MSDVRRLESLTTLRLGGPVRDVVRGESVDELVEAITRLDAAAEPILVVGGGSNIVVGDDGFDGTVVLVRNTGVAFDEEGGTAYVTAGAGVNWDDLVAETVDRGFGGLEALSGIPGCTGATPVQNVGAYGVEVADVLRGVQLVDRRDGSVAWVTPDDLHLAYRTSALKNRHEKVVLAVSFWLRDDGRSAPVRYRELAERLGVEAGAHAPAALVRETVLALRRGKGMVLDADDHDTWSVGSFFTNPILDAAAADAAVARIQHAVGADVLIPRFPGPDGSVKLSAGWLIERAGFHRGHPGPDAPTRLSTKHTLALTNRGRATTADLLALAAEVRDGVRGVFGVTLTPEPVLVNCGLSDAGGYDVVRAPSGIG